MKIYTYRLNNGARVLATFRRKELSPVGYANQTQAKTKREELLSHGFDCVIRQWNRNRYIELLGLPSFQGQFGMTKKKDDRYSQCQHAFISYDGQECLDCGEKAIGSISPNPLTAQGDDMTSSEVYEDELNKLRRQVSEMELRRKTEIETYRQLDEELRKSWAETGRLGNLLEGISSESQDRREKLEAVLGALELLKYAVGNKSHFVSELEQADDAIRKARGI